jgi:hypothetical protein
LKAILWVATLTLGGMLVGTGEALTAPSFLGLLTAWAIGSFLIAFSQIKILERNVEPLRWFTTTSLGFFIGLILANIISAFIAMGRSGFGLALSLVVGGAVADSVLGLLQFKFGTDQKLASSWILASSVSWALGMAAGYIIVNMILCQYLDLQAVTMLLLSQGITGGMIGLGTAIRSPLLKA